MKYLSLCLAMITLAACSDGSSIDYPYLDRNHNPLGNPTNPTQPFKDINAGTTGMLGRTDQQIADYIDYRLNQWNTYNPDTGKDISRLDIADAVRYLSTGTQSADEIAAHFADNFTLLHMAVYSINNALNNCFTGGDAGAGAACYTKWRDNNKELFDRMTNGIIHNITPINLADAEFTASDGATIKFIVDAETGKITGATLTTDGTEIKYEDSDFYYGWINDTDGTINRMKYDSVGKELNLSYADFGTYVISGINNSPNPVPFAGGYAAHAIAPDKIKIEDKDLVFRGTAVGTARDAKHTVALNGTAELRFKTDKQSTLGAEFADWYDILVDTKGNITFSNYSEPNNLVKLAATPDKDGTITATGATMTVNYYAPNPELGTPTESTGLVSYTEGTSGVKMDIAFGAKK